MKCKLHGNHCCAICVFREMHKKNARRNDKDYSIMIGLSFLLAAFIVGVAIYY